jgi:hypothetical protein
MKIIKMNRNLMSAALLVACAFGLVALSAAPAGFHEVVGDDASAQVARLHVLHAAYHESVSYNGDPLDRAEHLDLLKTLFAPDATLTVGGNTFSGRDAVLGWYANSAGPFIQNHNWVALSPAFRTALQPNGNTADIYFQCILVDPATDMVVGKVAFSGTAKKVGGEWVFWHMNVAAAWL